MRILRAVLALAAVSVTAMIVWVVPAGAAGTDYVALGDSYSSGVGAGDYTAASGDCDRSVHAYPHLWASAHSTASFTFVACSGATTSDVLSNQVGALGPDTSLVTMTIGGNDAGFSNVMETCVLGSDATCDSALQQATTFVDDTLPARLDHLYATVRQDAPSARVVVLGYPRLYHLGGGCIFGLSEHKHRAIDNAADELDRVIAGRAAAAGFTFSDVRDEFAPHEICSSHPWLHSVSLPLDESYHPTAAGQSGGYLPALDGVTG